MAHFKQQGWIVLESDFIFDMWLLTALKPYLPLPLLPHIWGKLIRKLMCVLPWHQWGSSNHAHPSLHAKTLTLAPPSNHSKTQGHCLFAQTIFRMTLLPALLSESLDMWVISLFMSSWCVCRVISLDLPAVTDEDAFCICGITITHSCFCQIGGNFSHYFFKYCLASLSSLLLDSDNLNVCYSLLSSRDSGD